MARRRSRSGGRGRKRAFFWWGIQGSIAALSATVSSIDLYDPSQAGLADTKGLRFEHLVVWLSFLSNSASVSPVSFALQHIPTSVTLAAQNILDPSSSDIDFFNKKQVMWGGRIQTPASTQQPVVVMDRIKSRRNVDSAQDFVVFTLAGTATTTLVQYWFRALYSKPA